MNNEYEEILGDWSRVSEYELQIIIFAILDRLNIKAVRTNKTKHGDEQIIFSETIQQKAQEK